MGCLKSKPSQDGSKPLLSDDATSYDTDVSHPRDTSTSTAYRGPSESDVSSASGHAYAHGTAHGGAHTELSESGARRGSSAASTPPRSASIAIHAAASPVVPIRGTMAGGVASSLLSTAPPPAAPVMVRPFVVDAKALAAVVERAEEDFLDVQRSAMDVESENPNDPNAVEFIRALRGVDVAADAFLARLAALPRPSAGVAPEAVVSALAADPLPRDVYARAHAGTAKMAQALDGVALLDTGAPIVVALA